MTLRASVVVPFYNSRETLGECLDALLSQNTPRDSYEIIAVDDGSTDGSDTVATREGVQLVRQKNGGASAARNAGIAVAKAKWVAFTDADCVPSRGWLRSLLNAVEKNSNASGAAGAVVGLPSTHSASRFVDIAGGFDVERHLSHPLFPFGMSGNVMYRAEDLRAVGGFDERFTSYESCDLNMRIRALTNQDLVFARSAVVLHRHRDSWGAYWRQQRNYGRGLGQFYRRYAGQVQWGMKEEIAEWASILPKAAMSCLPGDEDKTLVRRGNLVKAVAQRIGFASTYFKR